MRQEGVLLGLVETMNLVDEQQGAHPDFSRPSGLIHRFANLPDPGQYRRQGDEPPSGPLGHQASQGGFASPRWAPQDHGMQAPLLDGTAQGAAFSDQMPLAHELIKTPGTQTIRQGSRGIGKSSLSGDCKSLFESQKSPV
ncbi:conserved hypothetical protein [Gammaproteobacteria bacterium]